MWIYFLKKLSKKFKRDNSRKLKNAGLYYNRIAKQFQCNFCINYRSNFNRHYLILMQIAKRTAKGIQKRK